MFVLCPIVQSEHISRSSWVCHVLCHKSSTRQSCEINLNGNVSRQRGVCRVILAYKHTISTTSGKPKSPCRMQEQLALAAFIITCCGTIATIIALGVAYIQLIVNIVAVEARLVDHISGSVRSLQGGTETGSDEASASDQDPTSSRQSRLSSTSGTRPTTSKTLGFSCIMT